MIIAGLVTSAATSKWPSFGVMAITSMSASLTSRPSRLLASSKVSRPLKGDCCQQKLSVASTSPAPRRLASKLNAPFHAPTSRTLRPLDIDAVEDRAVFGAQSLERLGAGSDEAISEIDGMVPVVASDLVLYVAHAPLVSLYASEYPLPRVSTPRPRASVIQPNSLRICWL